MRSLSQTLFRLIAFTSFILTAVHADASIPASLEGHLLRVSTAYTSLRSITNRSIAFHANGTAQDNWVNLASTVSVPDIIYRDGVPETWTYTYTKLSESTAELKLTSASEKYNPLILHFTDDLSGTIEENPPRWSGFSGRFSLVEGAARVSPLINISTRVRVHAGEPTIIGFICAQSADFVIRIAGPALENFQVQDVWKTPKFQLFAGSRQIGVGALNSSASSQIFQRIGAFPFTEGSKDLAAVVALDPGPHTIVVQPDANDPGGNALIEVYHLY